MSHTQTDHDFKPCPFCGGKAYHNHGGDPVHGRLWWTIGCIPCENYMVDREVWLPSGGLDPAFPPKECFIRWNKRA